jgi:hypothetical protein
MWSRDRIHRDVVPMLPLVGTAGVACVFALFSYWLGDGFAAPFAGVAVATPADLSAFVASGYLFVIAGTMLTVTLHDYDTSRRVAPSPG